MKAFVYSAVDGAQDPESKQAYRMLWHGDPQYVSDTGYPLKRLYQKLNELKVKEVVLAMDSGFTGAGGTNPRASSKNAANAGLGAPDDTGPRRAGAGAGAGAAAGACAGGAALVGRTLCAAWLVDAGIRVGDGDSATP